VILLDRLLVGGIGWVLRRLADAADAEMVDESAVREELVAAEMRLELGEIDERQFEAIERDLLARLREIRKHRQGARRPAAKGERYAVEAIDADVGDDGSRPAPAFTGTSGRAPRARSGARPPRGGRRGRA
jgi:hypothetical protein